MPTDQELIADLRDWRGGTDIEYHLRMRAANALEAANQRYAELERREQNRHVHAKAWDRKNAAVNRENDRLRKVLKDTQHKLHILELERDLDVTWARRLELANKRLEMIRDIVII